ncbi:MAG: ABC transporter ATP-binding protein [Pyrinomonadaceae bacterium]|nr:ABC transporter ATP-binding protein [Pyrinomonadaceae bacterium]
MSARPYIGRALKLLGKHKTVVIVSTLFTLVGALMPFLVSASFGPLIQILGRASANGDLSGVWTLTGSLYSKAGAAEAGGLTGWMATPLTFTTIFIVWGVSSVVAVLIRFVQQWMTTNMEQKLVSEIQQEVYDHTQTLSLDFFTSGQTGALMQRVLSESQGVQRLLTGVLLTPLLDVIVLFIALAYLIGLSWQMTIVAFALGPLAFLLFRFTMTKLQHAAGDMAITSRDLSAELNESIAGIADIQVFNAQARRSQRFGTVARAATSATARMFAWMHLSNTASQIYVALSTAVVLLVGIRFGTAFGLTLASLIVFVGFVPAMFAPVQRVLTSYTTYKSLVPNVVATYELLDTKPTVLEKPGAKDLGEVHGHVKFDNVVFGYTPVQRVLNGISFNIREGETVSFVGPIGCGKSTIMNLLLRFLEPQSGRITIEDKDTSEVTLNSLRNQVSKLSQFPFFLKDTIRENVRLGKENATDNEIEEACRLAHIHDVIVDPDRMPQGYDTVVDVQVPSGGQKRLIALARCLIRKPEVLLLDEPTENLDADQRNRLTQVIREYAQGEDRRTCLVISHDLNFVAAVSDRIIVLKDGKVVDEGTHDELVQREGLYKTLYEMKNIDPALLRTRGGGAGGDDGLPPGAMPAGAMGMGVPL